MEDQETECAREGVAEPHRIGSDEVREIADVDAHARAAVFAGLAEKIRALVYTECPWIPAGVSLHIGLHAAQASADDVPLPTVHGALDWQSFESPPGERCVSVSAHVAGGLVTLFVGPRRSVAPTPVNEAA